MDEIPRLTGTHDVLGGDFERLQAIQRTLGSCFDAFGYRGVDTPLLERSELYLRKSGGEVVPQTYSFQEPGGQRVSVRPEFTASVIRSFIERRNETALPVRWHYRGPVLRYVPPTRSRYRQFTQQGVELIGAPAPEADAEVLALVAYSLASLGAKGCRLVIGHVGALLRMLRQFELPDRVESALLARLDMLSRGRDVAENVARELLAFGVVPQQETAETVGQYLRDLKEDEARAVVRGLLSSMETNFTGSRTPEEIARRLLDRLRQAASPQRLERAIAFVIELTQAQGAPDEALRQARGAAANHGVDASPLDELAHILDLVGGEDLEGLRLSVDLGLTRGLAYYSGMVFEVYGASPTGNLPLCGGGRYDGLVRALGGREDVPGLGFSFGLELLVEALAAQSAPPLVAEREADVLVFAASPAAQRWAMATASRLRSQGRRVTVDVTRRSREANLEHARRLGIPEVVEVADGGATTQLAVSTPTGAVNAAPRPA